MKRKFWIALLPLCGCFCVEAGITGAFIGIGLGFGFAGNTSVK